MTLFLRGRSARGLSKESAPKSLTAKLALMLGMSALFGLTAFFFIGQPVFALSAFIHAITFMFIGMFVAASVGEILFNNEEAEILLHRPIQPRTLLRAKIAVLGSVSILMAVALNSTAIFVGLAASDGHWSYPLAHALSTVVEALFCAGCAVLLMQLCLKWFGRERVESVMTTAQVILTVGFIVASQVVPRMMSKMVNLGEINWRAWWIDLLPPAWFADMDDAISGSHSQRSLLIGAGAVLLTVLMFRAVLGRLAHTYQTGMQSLTESAAPSNRSLRGRSKALRMASTKPMSWLLRDGPSRASFVLCLAYLTRDRDVKLRIYPSLASFLVMPIVLMVTPRGVSKEASDALFGIAIFTAGAYLSDLPFVALRALKFSAHWRSAEIFHTTPVPGPWPFHLGARVAVVAFLALPLFVALAVFGAVTNGPQTILMLLPGLLLLPAYCSLEGATDSGILLSRPSEEARSAQRGCDLMLYMLVSFIVGGIAGAAWYLNFFTIFLVLEAVAVFFVTRQLDASLKRTGWQSLE